MSANQDILDAAIRHALYEGRFGKGLARRMVSLLDEVDDDLANQLSLRLTRIGTDTGPATTRRLTEMMDTLRVLNSRVYRRFANELEAELIGLAGFEIEDQTASLARILPVEVASVAPTAALLKTIVTATPIDGFLLKPWVDSMAANRLARIEKQLRIGMVEGQTIDQLVRRIRGTKSKAFKDGILEISRRSAETLALTATSTIANAAREAVYKKNADLISKLKWLSTLDSRTSPTCQSRDGKLYDLDKPHPTPPAHPRCRSVMIPVTVSFDSLGLEREEYTPGQRASMNGQVPGSTTFEDWIRGQPKSRVVEIYGKERADLFLSGKIPFNDLYKNDGSFYSLADLRRQSSGPAAPKAAPAPAPARVERPVTNTPSLADINGENDRELKSYTLVEGRKKGKEHMALYNAATGSQLERVTDGKKGSVAFTPAMLEALRDPKNQMVIHHNHPSSSSFSPADLRIVHEFAGAKGIWAHGHNGSSYYAEAGARRMTQSTYNLWRKHAQQWVQRKVNAREMDTGDANTIFYHVVTLLTEKMGYLKYTADLQGPTLEAFNRNKTLIEGFLNSIKGPDQ